MNEFLVSMMSTYVVQYVLQLLLRTVLQEPKHEYLKTEYLDSSVWLPKILTGTSVSLGIVIAVAAVLIWFILYHTPLILGALGEVLAERTGMMVTAVEGIFLIGAWGGFIGAYLSGNLLVGFLTAMLCGVAVAALYGVTTVFMNQHQIVMGTAIVFYVIYKTSLGLSMRSCGENPEAADAAGINVPRMRFLAVLVAGGLSGIAGAYYPLCNVGMYNAEIIGGRGWIAFGICFLGNWNPVGALIFGIVFGISDALGTYVKALGNASIPSELFSALPYILVIVLTVCRKQFNVPAKLGSNYVKED